MIGTNLLSVFALVCFVNIAAGLGSRLLRALGLDHISVSEQFVFGLALGLGVFSYALFGLGSAGLLRVWVVVMLLLLAIALAWREIYVLIRFLLGYLRGLSVRLRHARRWNVLVLALLSLLAVLNLVGALAPPTMMDGLRYLGGAREYIVRGRIEFIPVFWWNYPGLYETLFSGALLLQIEALPALLHWLAGVASTIGLFQIGRRIHSASAGAIAALVYYTMPIVTDRSTSPKSELALALFGLLSIYALVLWLHHEKNSWLWVSAIMAGLQASTKLQGLGPMTASCAAAVIALALARKRSPGDAVLLMAKYGLVAVLVGSPWYVRNFIASGDPMWPMGYGIFHGRFWNEANYLKFSAWQRGVGGGAWNYLIGPWNVTQSYAAFGDIRVATSPLFLIFVPLVPLVWRKARTGSRHVILLCLVYSWVHYTTWFLRYQHSGYLSFMWPELALVAGIVAVLLAQFGRVALTAVCAAILVYLPVGLGTALVFNSQFIPVVLGLQARSNFLAERVYYFEDIQWTNQNLPEDSRLLYMPLQAFYYLDRDYLVAHANYQGFLDYELYSSSTEFLADLCSRGVTHIFWTSGEDAEPASLVAQLRESGWLTEIYRNEEGREILSRTFRRYRYRTVAIYRIEYPSDACVGSISD